MNLIKSLPLVTCLFAVTLSASASTFVFVDEGEIERSRALLQSEDAPRR